MIGSVVDKKQKGGIMKEYKIASMKSAGKYNIGERQFVLNQFEKMNMDVHDNQSSKLNQRHNAHKRKIEYERGEPCKKRRRLNRYPNYSQIDDWKPINVQTNIS